MKAHQSDEEFEKEGHQSGPGISRRKTGHSRNKVTDPKWFETMHKEVKRDVDVIVAEVGGVKKAARIALTDNGSEQIVNALISKDPERIHLALSLVGYRQKRKSLKEKFLGNKAKEITQRLMVERNLKKNHCSNVLNRYLTAEIAQKLLSPATFHEGMSMIPVWAEGKNYTV